MALELSVEAEAFLQQTNIQPNIILEIDGFDFLFGAVKVTKVARFDEGYTFDSGLIFDGGIADPTSKDFISLSGTTNRITQQLFQDKGGSSSVTSFKINLIDKDNELTRIFSPGVTVPDILGREAVIYYQTQGSKHPEDSVRLFVGIISSASFAQGSVQVTVQHPETLKRQEILPKITGKLTFNITPLNTNILVDTLEGFVVPQENLTSYIRINDEIIKIRDTTSAPGFVVDARAQFGTSAASHSVGDEYETIYRLEGDPIELALRLMLSGGDRAFAAANASRLEQVSADTRIRGAVFFPEPNIQDRLGLVTGDRIAILSGASVSNRIGFTPIISFGTTANGSYVVVDRDFDPEIELVAGCEFESKYYKFNVGGGFGGGLKPYQVDVAQFESLQETFSAQFFNYDYFIKQTVNLKEFIDSKLFFPSSLFSLPRQGRVSVGISAPPIIGPNAKTLNASNITNASRVAMTRSINNSFYNAIAWKYDEDAVEEKFVAANVTQSADSVSRINIGNRVLTIEAGGIRDTTDNRNKIEAISRRFLDRYQFGAEKIKVETNFKTAFPIEPGDTVILDGETISLSDISSGTRDFRPRVMEVTNKEISLTTGKAVLELTDTNLSTQLRYGVWAPASLVGSGSTTSSIVIKRSFGTTELELERDKWSDYIGKPILVRSSNYATENETIFVGFSAGNPNILLVNPALPSAPSEDFVVEPPNYGSAEVNRMRLYKSLHCFFSPQVAVVSGTTTTVTVDSADIDKFFVNCRVRIHTANYSDDAVKTVAEINTNTLTLNTELDFTPDNTYIIDDIGFASDKGASYSFY